MLASRVALRPSETGERQATYKGSPTETERDQSVGGGPSWIRTRWEGEKEEGFQLVRSPVLAWRQVGDKLRALLGPIGLAQG